MVKVAEPQTAARPSKRLAPPLEVETRPTGPTETTLALRVCGSQRVRETGLPSSRAPDGPKPTAWTAALSVLPPPSGGETCKTPSPAPSAPSPLSSANASRPADQSAAQPVPAALRGQA